MAKKRNLRKEINEKLHDEVLRGALGRFAEAYPIARAKALENVEDVEALRDQLKETKRYAVDHIEEIADRFEIEAVKRGAKVFRAATGKELISYLINLCKERAVRRIVKSKSMASEEIHLNDALEKAGIRVKETDLGEWIISIAGHKPSHMVMPAIHLNRYQVADYFSKELDKSIDPDIAFMVQTSRTTLRDEFLKADMGISGANFGIAESGTIGLFTNEGNARLATTIPPIHVVIIGYEKLVPSIKDTVPILRLLPRGATGQLMTSYMSMIAGPTPCLVQKNGRWEETLKELHIILLDNGRLAAAHDEKLKEIYQCVRCASCLNVCPVYALVGGHVYGGQTYAGGIGAILTAFLGGMEEFEQFNELCIGCRKCVTVCPGKIDIPGLIEELRRRSIKEKGLPFIMSRIFDVMSNRRFFHGLLKAASIAQKPFTSQGLVRHLPLFLAGMTKDRSLPGIAAAPLRDRVDRIVKPIEKPDKKVGFFSGCTMDFVFPETGENVIKVIQDLNMSVSYPDRQGCCGKPVAATGDVEYTKKIAKNNIEAFEAVDVEVIICACPTGVEQIREYPHLFKDDPEWRDRAQSMADKMKEFCTFVAGEYEKRGRLKKAVKSHNPLKITYHDSCHLRRVLNVHDEPRKLIESIEGCEFVEMKDADKCCGMSGSFGVKYSNLSIPILKEKMKNIKDAQAEIVVCACSGCMVQLQGGIDQQAPGLKLKHVADLLAEHLESKNGG
ncbi:MAG: LUD domain-containing protein [Deltaproteobacteria bacterium]|nr:LUD domain-containing protein [Deltaproteobacteria bacterium]